MACVAAHTHDDIDWSERLSALRRADELDAAATAVAAERLVADLPPRPVVVDAGCGAGGMSKALAVALAARSGGTLVLVDAVPELLTAAAEVAAPAAAGLVEIEQHQADAADGLPFLSPVDLIWASGMVHHLPDQQAAVTAFAGALKPGGVLALGEGGLDIRCLPYDLGVGVPGLEGRLHTARDAWFLDMRTTMPGAVRMPYGWGRALAEAGLTGVSSFSYLLEHPAPLSALARDYVLERLDWFVEVCGDRIAEADRIVLRALLDPAAPEYAGSRADLFVLGARTVHHGRSR